MLLKLDVQCQWFYLLQVPSTDITTGRVTLQENKMVPLTGKAEFANAVLSQASAHSQANAHPPILTVLWFFEVFHV